MYQVQAYEVGLGFIDVAEGTFADLGPALARLRVLVEGGGEHAPPVHRGRIVDETGRVHTAILRPSAAGRSPANTSTRRDSV